MDEFAMKTVTCLERGIHVLLVDPFPPGAHDPHGMHYEILRRLRPDCDWPPPDAMGQASLVSYAMGRQLDVYKESAAIGDGLPEMPLFFTTERYVNVPLETTYPAAWRGMPRFWKEVLER